MYSFRYSYSLPPIFSICLLNDSHLFFLTMLWSIFSLLYFLVFNFLTLIGLFVTIAWRWFNKFFSSSRYCSAIWIIIPSISEFFSYILLPTQCIKILFLNNYVLQIEEQFSIRTVYNCFFRLTIAYLIKLNILFVRLPTKETIYHRIQLQICKLPEQTSVELKASSPNARRLPHRYIQSQLYYGAEPNGPNYNGFAAKLSAINLMINISCSGVNTHRPWPRGFVKPTNRFWRIGWKWRC